MLPELQPDSHSNNDGEIKQERKPLELFDLVDNINCPPNFHSIPPTAEILNVHRASESIGIKASPKAAAFWPHLKTVPLASYYSLHRVPSYPSMEGQQQNGVHEIPRTDTLPVTEPPNGIHNKPLEQVIRTPGRQPSPQPTHLSVPGPSQHRILHEEGSGYVAPKFEGKETQMDQGQLHFAK